MEKYIFSQFKHFGLFFMINLRYYVVFYLFICLGITLIVFGLSFLFTISQPQIIKDFFNQVFWTFMNIGGIILTTSAFSIYGRKENRMRLYTLPVSPVARLTSAFLITIPLLIILMSLTYTLIVNGISWMFASQNLVKHFTFNPIHADYIPLYDHLKFYIIFQSVMLMTGSFFPKLGFIKSILACVVFLLLYMLINVISSHYPVDHAFFSNLFRVLTTNNYQNLQLRRLMPLTTFIFRSVWLMVLPLTLYIVYLRIKEIEV